MLLVRLMSTRRAMLLRVRIVWFEEAFNLSAFTNTSLRRGRSYTYTHMHVLRKVPTTVSISQQADSTKLYTIYIQLLDTSLFEFGKFSYNFFVKITATRTVYKRSKVYETVSYSFKVAYTYACSVRVPVVLIPRLYPHKGLARHKYCLPC